MTTTDASPMLPDDFIREARALLSIALDHACGSVVQELQALMPALPEAQASGQAPANLPDWLRKLPPPLPSPDGSPDWASIRAALSDRTALYLSRLPIPEAPLPLSLELHRLGLSSGYYGEPQENPPPEKIKVTGWGLEKALGVDLHEVCADYWKGLDGSYLPEAQAQQCPA